MQTQIVNNAEINPAVIMRGKNSNPYGRRGSGGGKSSGSSTSKDKKKPKKGKK